MDVPKHFAASVVECTMLLRLASILTCGSRGVRVPAPECPQSRFEVTQSPSPVSYTHLTLPTICSV
eukprot:7609555-Alexandrium_andersonii.AAC.1